MKCLLSNSEASNTYIIERFECVVIVDPSHSLEEIKNLIEGKKLEAILLTHAHIDHSILIGQFNCPIYIHELDLEMLFDDNINGANYLGIKRTFKRNSLDIKLIKDGDIINLADKQIKVIHTPGHTKGSVCYRYNDDLITGDTLFKNSVGRWDFEGGSLKSLKQSLRVIFNECEGSVKIYPGHDELSTIKDEIKNNQYYLKWVKL